MLHRNSCFLDCASKLTGLEPEALHAKYMAETSGATPEVDGYHPQLFGFRLHQLAPVVGDRCLLTTKQVEERYERIMNENWLCILVGPKLLGGGEHAIAHYQGNFWCPSEGVIVSPNIGLRDIYTL